MTPCPHPVMTLSTPSDSVSTYQDQDQDQDLRPEQIAKVKPASTSLSLGGKNRQALDALNEAIAIHGFRQFGAQWPGCDVVLVDDWRRQFYAHCIGNAPEARKKAFQRAREALEAAGLIAFHDDHVWRCPDSPGKNGPQGYLKEGA